MSTLLTCVCCSEDIEDRAFGTCQTCSEETGRKDGSLCQTCFDFHTKANRGNVRKLPFQGHSFSETTLDASTEPSPQDVLLQELGLTPAFTTCPRHAELVTGLVCTECVVVQDPGDGLCLSCVRLHSQANPSHTLKPVAPVVADLRAALASASRQAVDECRISDMAHQPSEVGGVAQGRGSASSSSSNPPVVECARHKAVALQREIETLKDNTESTLREWDARRDAVIMAAHNYFDAGRMDITTTAAARRAALETEAVAADCVLEKSIRVTRGLDEVRI